MENLKSYECTKVNRIDDVVEIPCSSVTYNSRKNLELDSCFFYNQWLFKVTGIKKHTVKTYGDKTWFKESQVYKTTVIPILDFSGDEYKCVIDTCPIMKDVRTHYTENTIN
jgi:hypothetical protein